MPIRHTKITVELKYFGLTAYNYKLFLMFFMLVNTLNSCAKVNQNETLNRQWILFVKNDVSFKSPIGATGSSTIETTGLPQDGAAWYKNLFIQSSETKIIALRYTETVLCFTRSSHQRKYCCTILMQLILTSSKPEMLMGIHPSSTWKRVYRLKKKWIALRLAEKKFSFNNAQNFFGSAQNYWKTSKILPPTGVTSQSIIMKTRIEKTENVI